MLTIKEPDWWKVGRAYWAIIGNLHTLTIYTGPRRATLCQNVLEEKEEKNFKKIVRSLASPWPDIGGISRHVIKRLTPSLDTQSPRCWFVRLKQDGATFDFIGRKIGALENGANSEMNYRAPGQGMPLRESGFEACWEPVVWTSACIRREVDWSFQTPYPASEATFCL